MNCWLWRAGVITYPRNVLSAICWVWKEGTLHIPYVSFPPMLYILNFAQYAYMKCKHSMQLHYRDTHVSTPPISLWSLERATSHVPWCNALFHLAPPPQSAWVATQWSPHIVSLTSSQCSLTHRGRDKMAAIFQTTFSNTFSWIKTYEFWLKFQWSLFQRVQLTIFQHWFW